MHNHSAAPALLPDTTRVAALRALAQQRQRRDCSLSNTRNGGKELTCQELGQKQPQPLLPARAFPARRRRPQPSSTSTQRGAMSGRFSGLPSGKSGLGKGANKRHRKVPRDTVQGVTKPAIRRLARRGGVKRINGLVYEETRGVLKVFLENIIRDAITYTEHAHRHRVTVMDVIYALKRQGRTLFGFGG
jgi:histone H4